MQQLILASQSPRRRELLGRIVKNFSVDAAQAEEKRDPAWTVQELPRMLAQQKALEVSGRHPAALVVGADTIVALDGQALGKPRNETDAGRMLRALSGRTHQVYTGVAFCRGGQVRSSFVQCTEVDFYPLEEERIRWYLASGEPFDKAGAYGIQGLGGLLVKGIRGDYCNVVGLPLARFVRELERLMKEDR
ncbi:MAG: septum formation protein Maf [Oscillospiraceae bacterium]|nr:septum formation protein Maf [Oscillospiraceae bacterium]